MVECTGLENRRRSNPSVSSNLTASARIATPAVHNHPENPIASRVSRKSAVLGHPVLPSKIPVFGGYFFRVSSHARAPTGPRRRRPVSPDQAQRPEYWQFRNMKPDGCGGLIQIGPYPRLTLDAARAARNVHRAATLRPWARRKIDTARSLTFKQCAEAFIDARSAEWVNPKHTQQGRTRWPPTPIPSSARCPRRYRHGPDTARAGTDLASQE